MPLYLVKIRHSVSYLPAFGSFDNVFNKDVRHLDSGASVIQLSPAIKCPQSSSKLLDIG